MARGKKHRESQQQPASQSTSPGPSGADSSNSQQKPQPKQAKPGYDKFILENTFPDIKAMLQPQPSVSEFTKDALFVLDTNVLLDPFEVGTKTLEEISTIFERLANADRLYVPARVLREFARHRTEKMKELYVKVAEKLIGIQSPELGLKPLKSFAGYQLVDTAYRSVNAAIEKYRESLAKLRDEIADWNWNDDITKTYLELFEGDAIIEPGCDEQKLEDDLRNRVTHNLPPGFGDASKDDGGIGDIIIWQCILNLGKITKKSIVFVTQEKNKGDWVVKGVIKGNGKALYPRFELIHEFRSVTGQNLAIMDFEKFMAFNKASPEAILEVKQVSTANESKAVFGNILLGRGALIRQLIVDVKTAAIAVNEFVKDQQVLLPVRLKRQLLPQLSTNILLLLESYEDYPVSSSSSSSSSEMRTRGKIVITSIENILRMDKSLLSDVGVNPKQAELYEVASLLLKLLTNFRADLMNAGIYEVT
jgi:predicted nucleic-acid-binding protein